LTLDRTPLVLRAVPLCAQWEVFTVSKDELTQVTDSMGNVWLEGWVPPEACKDGDFRPVPPDRVRKLLPTIAAQGQQVAGLAHLTNEEIILEQGRTRRKIAEILRRLFYIRIALNATPEMIRTMRAAVEESNEKLDDISSLQAVRDTMRSEGVSAAVAAAEHHIRPEVISRIGYVLDLETTDPFFQLVMSRKLKTDWITALKPVPHSKRLEYAHRLIEGKLTAKALKDELAAAKKSGSAPKSLTYSRSVNGTKISATYREREDLIAELRAAADELEEQEE
jgi:hypothetical protein